MMHSIIPLIKKEKIGSFRPRGARFGLDQRFSVTLHHLSDQPVRLPVNFNQWRKNSVSNIRLLRRLTALSKLMSVFS
jgi:hypothetical protein